MSVEYKLWGMDGSLQGSERWGRLLPPAIHYADQVWLARTTQWNPADAATGKLLTLERAAEVLTPLPSEMKLSIQPGEKVLLLGVDYQKALVELGEFEALKSLLKLAPLGDGFWVGSASLAMWEGQARQIIQAAKTCYYKALREGAASPSPRAQAAYHAMIGAGLFTGDEAIVLQVAHALWTKNDNRVHNVVQTGKIRFGMDEQLTRQQANTLLSGVRMTQRYHREPDHAAQSRPPGKPFLSGARSRRAGAFTA